MKSAREEMREVEAKMRDINARIAASTERVRAAKREADRLKDDNCPTCAQPISAKLRKSLTKAVADAEKEAAEVTALEKHKDSELNELLDELRDERDDIDTQLREVESFERARRVRQKAIDEYERLKKKHAHDIDLITKALDEVEHHLDEELERVAAAEEDLAELKAVDKVLGLQGVRAHVLGQALEGIQEAANAWLVRLQRPDLRVVLTSYTESQKGNVRDCINLQVEGAGGGHGYKAASGGERRRIDVALLLALAEVAGAAHGDTGGTLWFDEVFDALDDPGVEAVTGAIEELGETHSVVVITHNPQLVARLPKARRLHVDDGHVFEQDAGLTVKALKETA